MSERFRDMFNDWQDDEGPPDEFDELERIEPRRLDEKEVRVVGVYEHQESGIPPQFLSCCRTTADVACRYGLANTKRCPSPWRWKVTCQTVL
jgi:hypothetical protein